MGAHGRLWGIPAHHPYASALDASVEIHLHWVEARTPLSSATRINYRLPLINVASGYKLDLSHLCMSPHFHKGIHSSAAPDGLNHTWMCKTFCTFHCATPVLCRLIMRVGQTSLPKGSTEGKAVTFLQVGVVSKAVNFFFAKVR